MLADRIKRPSAGSPRSAPADDAAPDSSAASTGPRELALVNPKQTAPKAKPSRYADALFLAHVFASKFDAPQQREKRRADPADANASYRKSAKKPAKLGRVLSKKI